MTTIHQPIHTSSSRAGARDATSESNRDQLFSTLKTIADKVIAALRDDDFEDRQARIRGGAAKFQAKRQSRSVSTCEDSL